MQDTVPTRAPAHLWVVGSTSLLWNLFGAVNYLATRLRSETYVENMMPGVDAQATFAWVDAFPMWAQFGWGLGVWFALAGSILLLLRHRYAVAAFGVSLVGILLGLGYQILLAPPPPGAAEQGGGQYVHFVVIAVGVALFLYARAIAAKGVLRR